MAKLASHHIIPALGLPLRSSFLSFKWGILKEQNMVSVSGLRRPFSSSTKISMSLKAGIVGLPNVGKSTLFNAVVENGKAQAANFPFCTIEPNVGIVAVPDPRLHVLSNLSKSQRAVPASIEFVDIAGLVKGASQGEGLGNKFLTHIREVDSILQDVIFCKSILNEFAAKMRFEMPNYTTTQTEGILPVFVSSLVFNGKLYTGPAGRNKKEAEQLAARTVIQSILANHGAGTCLSQIIKSKTKLYAALHKIRNSGLDQGSGLVQDSGLAQDAVLVQPTGLIQQTNVPVGINPGNSDNSPRITQNKRKDASENLSHVHIFRKPKQEQCVTSTGPIEFVPAVQDQPANGCPAILASNTSGPLSNVLLMTQNQAMMPPKKNKKRKPKKPKCDQSQTAAVPISQASSCSVAL